MAKVRLIKETAGQAERPEAARERKLLWMKLIYNTPKFRDLRAACNEGFAERRGRGGYQRSSASGGVLWTLA